MLISNDSRAFSRGEISYKQEKATDSWKQVGTNAFQQPVTISKEKYNLLSLNAITSDVDRDHIRYLRIPRATNHNLFYDIN